MKLINQGKKLKNYILKKIKKMKKNWKIEMKFFFWKKKLKD